MWIEFDAFCCLRFPILFIYKNVTSGEWLHEHQEGVSEVLQSVLQNLRYTYHFRVVSEDSQTSFKWALYTTTSRRIVALQRKRHAYFSFKKRCLEEIYSQSPRGDGQEEEVCCGRLQQTNVQVHQLDPTTIRSLPAEMIAQVTSYLSPVDVANMHLTCTWLCNITRHAEPFSEQDWCQFHRAFEADARRKPRKLACTRCKQFLEPSKFQDSQAKRQCNRLRGRVMKTFSSTFREQFAYSLVSVGGQGIGGGAGDGDELKVLLGIR